MWKMLMTGTAMLMTIGTARAAILTGYIAITDANTGAAIGYVGNTFDAGGLYVTTKDPSKRLLVAFEDRMAPFSMLAYNNSGDAPYPFFGGIQGINSSNATLGADSGNYAIVVGTVQTLPCAPPVLAGNSFVPFFDPVSRLREAESSIWLLSKTNTLSAQWVNPDGSLPVTNIVLSQDILNPAESVLILTGNPAQSAAIFGPGPTVTLSFVATEVPQGYKGHLSGWRENERPCSVDPR